MSQFFSLGRSWQGWWRRTLEGEWPRLDSRGRMTARRDVVNQSKLAPEFDSGYRTGRTTLPSNGQPGSGSAADQVLQQGHRLR